MNEAGFAESNSNLEAISAIKKRINEIAFSPLEEHGVKFDEINSELSQALTSVEGISTQS
ncbi:MAG: hypothetical protein RL733_398 [Actinomycetota bacterium]|jgi:hypothetical protein